MSALNFMYEEVWAHTQVAPLYSNALIRRGELGSPKILNKFQATNTPSHRRLAMSLRIPALVNNSERYIVPKG